MDKFLRLKIKTKLTFGIGLLFTMIVLLGGLAVQNITDMSSDTQNILADNYNSLLYSRRMLDALERIKNDPQARAEFEKNLDLQQKNITEIDENVATAHLVAQYEAMHRDLNDTTIQRVRMALDDLPEKQGSRAYGGPSIVMDLHYRGGLCPDCFCFPDPLAPFHYVADP